MTDVPWYHGIDFSHMSVCVCVCVCVDIGEKEEWRTTERYTDLKLASRIILYYYKSTEFEVYKNANDERL